MMREIGVIGGASNLFLRFKSNAERSDVNFVTFGRRLSKVYLDLGDESGEGGYDSLFSRSSGAEFYMIFAGITKPDECARDTWRSFRINVVKLIKVINALCKMGKRVLFVSSDAVFEGVQGVATEDSSRSPISVYGMQKSMVEEYFSEHESVKMVRLSYVLCGSDFLFSEKSYVSDVSLYSNFYRNVVFESDVFRVFERYLDEFDRMPKVLNVGGPDCISKYEIGLQIAKDRGFNLPRPSLADSSFFSNRVSRINMASDFLDEVLGRRAMSITEILSELEFRT